MFETIWRLRDFSFSRFFYCYFPIAEDYRRRLSQKTKKVILFSKSVICLLSILFAHVIFVS